MPNIRRQIHRPRCKPHLCSTGARVYSKWGDKVFRGHIASDTLGKTLATARPSGGQFFLSGPWGSGPPLAPALHLCTACRRCGLKGGLIRTVARDIFASEMKRSLLSQSAVCSKQKHVRQSSRFLASALNCGWTQMPSPACVCRKQAHTV